MSAVVEKAKGILLEKQEECAKALINECLADALDEVKAEVQKLTPDIADPIVGLVMDAAKEPLKQLLLKYAEMIKA